MTKEEINRYIHVEILNKEEFTTKHDWRIPAGETVFWCLGCKFKRGAEGKYCRSIVPDYCSDESPRSLLNGVVRKVLDTFGLKCDPFFRALSFAAGAEGTFLSPFELMRINAECVALACVNAHKSTQEVSHEEK